jgi:hypothetical protein
MPAAAGLAVTAASAEVPATSLICPGSAAIANFFMITNGFGAMTLRIFRDHGLDCGNGAPQRCPAAAPAAPHFMNQAIRRHAARPKGIITRRYDIVT